MKAGTQTHKESKSKKFTFPRNSLTYESCSEPTDPYISTKIDEVIKIKIIDSQNDAASNINDELVFDVN